MRKNKIYFDYAATTSVDPRVQKVMEPFFSEKFGNTMSLHSFGQEAKLALEQSREKIADFIGSKPNEIIFTGSATESNNWVLKGVVAKFVRSHKFCTGSDFHRINIVISQIEHPCIMETANWLEKKGAKLTRIPVDKYGLVNPLDIKKAITKETILVSIIHVSNEIGTIQPIEEIGRICREKKVLFHTDTAQSFGKIPIDVNKMNIDLLTASSHKIYGPKGAALLFVRQGIIKGAKLQPLLHGGGQEMGLRSSTVNVPAIVGFAKAVEIAEKEMKRENQRLEKLGAKLVKNVLKIENSHLIGPALEQARYRVNHPEKRLPNIIAFWFDFIEGESIVIQFDLLGIAASTGSACSSLKLEPSPVLLAIGLKPQQAHGSLRISLGRWTTEKEVDYFIKVLPGIIKKLRKISPFK